MLSWFLCGKPCSLFTLFSQVDCLRLASYDKVIMVAEGFLPSHVF
jgi:hypothetical protein